MKLFVATFFCLFIFSGCTQQTVVEQAAVQHKAVDTTLTGTVTKTGNKYYIQTMGKPITELDSYTVKFDQFVGQKVSVTGQYSGDTLFVDIISSQ